MNNTSFKGFLLLFLTALCLGSCTNSYKVIETSSENNTVISELSTTDSLYVIAKPYKMELEASMSEVLNVASVNLEREVPEGLLNNFVADLTLSTARSRSAEFVDVCLLNNGGLRVPIMKGEVTRGMIFELMPFENELLVLDLAGEEMIDLINYVVLRSTNENAKTGVALSGMRVTISNGKASHVMIGTSTFDPEKTYRVVTSDYLAGGGDDMTFFAGAVDSEKLDVKLRDAILDYISGLAEKNIKIDAELDGRVYIAE
ncbi:5'-nucleotidase C-terminal domain-containing protein [Parvicella tangerina]|uniref:5'-Nucleotidase C-terminal domain-containing protein n=1 Tax=Parvicella tangerina TaxID=2829795 RepID=A0A916JKD1_9FLAO|nr:5'-nucleotidase [Parvicella tangerina]CAG5077467.1 hypothetical protein CRYO30217_00395 [Parvicella tangerina]